MNIDNLRFVWVAHNDPQSIEEVRLALSSFNPDIICLELTIEIMKKLLKSKLRFKSEMFLAYRYAVENNKRLIFLEKDQERALFLMDISIIKLLYLLFIFICRNLKNILSFNKLEKIDPRMISWLSKLLIEERDKLLTKKIKTITNNYPHKRILFVIGKAHKEGILRLLKCS